jgi:uncharacterized protein YkwD
MKKIIRISIISVVLIIVLLNIAGCSPSISQEEYDSVKNELSNVQLQVETLQEKLSEALLIETQYDQLNAQYQELKNQYDAQIGENQVKKSEYDDLFASYGQLQQQYDDKNDELQGMYIEYDQLNQEFEDLKEQYDILQGNAVFSEEEIDQAIFDLINQERSDNGLEELEWGIYIYGWARQNSVAMAQTGDLKYSSWLSVQAVLITAGQATLDGLVNGVMAVWKQQTHEFSPKILNASVKYGAVATYKSGDVYYITYVASTSP